MLGRILRGGEEGAVNVNGGPGAVQEKALLVGDGEAEHRLACVRRIAEGSGTKGADVRIVGPDMGLRIDHDGMPLFCMGPNGSQKVFHAHL